MNSSSKWRGRQFDRDIWKKKIIHGLGERKFRLERNLKQKQKQKTSRFMKNKKNMEGIILQLKTITQIQNTQSFFKI